MWLVVPLAAPGAQRVDREAIIQALLERSRLLEDIQVSVPLRLYRRYVRASLRPQAGRPAPVALVVARGTYSLEVPADLEPRLTAELRLRVFHPQQCAATPVLSGDLAWEGIEVNGQPARLATEDGWLRFSPEEPGDYLVVARAWLPKARPQGGSLRLAIPRGLRTALEFRSPRAWQVEVGGAPLRLRGSAGDGTDGRVPLAPRHELSVAYGPPPVEFERAPRYELRGSVAWDIGPAVQSVAARLHVAIWGGRTDRIDLSLADAAERVRVSGPDVREIQVNGGRVAVFLRGRIGEHTRLDVRYELPLAAGGVHRLGPLAVRDGHWGAGTLVVTNRAGDSEVLADELTGLRQIALSTVPQETRAMLAGPPVLAWSIAARRWAAAVDVVDLGEFALRETIADLAHYQVALLGDGTRMCRVRYEIRNRTRQFLRVDLPPGARVLLARVNEESRPLTPVPEAPDAYLLPLVRSTASVQGLVSFPAELVAVWRAEALQRRGRADIPLPRIDLPIAYAWCEAYLPDEMAVRRWAGPLKEVEQYSSETAAATLGYGRGHAAPGYQPQPTPPGADQPPPTLRLQTADERIALAKNYYRAGRDYYAQKKLDEAARHLREVVELYPKSPEAANARRLLANIDVARGERELASRAEKAAGAQVMQEIQVTNEPLRQRQQLYLERGLQALKRDRVEDAKAHLEAAEGLGKVLIDQGADRREQSARLRVVREQLDKLEKTEARKAAELRQRMNQLRGTGRYDEALQVGQQLRRLAPTTGGGKAQPQLGDELEELTVLAARKKALQRRRRQLVQKAQALPHGRREAGERRLREETKRLAELAREEPEDLEHLEKQVEKLEEAYSARVPKPPEPKPEEKPPPARPAPAPVLRTYDVRGLVADVPTAGEKLEDVLVRLRTGEEADEDAYTVRYRNGRIVVRGTRDYQEQVGALLDRLQAARGPQVELGQSIAEQRATGQISATDFWGDVDGDAPRVPEQQFERFLRRNYRWQAQPEGEAAGLFSIGPLGTDGGYSSEGALRTSDLARKLRQNLDQVVDVNSINFSLPAEAARRLGVRFTTGDNDLRFATIDEAQFRTLAQLAARRAGQRTGVEPNAWFQETIVGTEVLLANRMVASNTFAGEEANRFVVAGNTVEVPHEQYLLIDNDGFLTAVRAGEMRHWLEAPKAVHFAPVPQDIEVPRLGRLAKLEKTLVEPSDVLVLQATYRWKGELR
ncbi:MAG: tetratricopeptide repeat protein [Candidatus Brocadiia bacterium]